MTLVEKLPTLPDAGLAALRDNATRLGQSGTPAQKDAAAELLPAIEAELEARRQAKSARLREAAAARRRAAPAPAKRTGTTKRAAKGAKAPVAAAS
jgi:hypothetical protein